MNKFCPLFYFTEYLQPTLPIVIFQGNSKKTFIMSGRSSYEFWLDCNQVGIHKTAGIRVWCPAVWGGGTTDKA